MYSLMIVEDHKWTREGLVKTIPWEKIGVQVKYECKNGIEAMDIVKKCNVDIILSDIKMQGMDGIELTKQVKQVNNDIQIILISAYQNFHYAMQAVNLGANAYILKPIDENELIEKIKETIDNIDREKNIKNKLSIHNMQNVIGIFKDYLLNKSIDEKTAWIELLKENKKYATNYYILFIAESISEDISATILCKYIQQGWDEVCLLETDDYCIGIMPVLSSTDIYAVRRRLHNVFSKYDNLDYRICMGEEVTFHNMDDSINNTLLYLNQCYLTGKEGFNTFDKSQIIGRNQRRSKIFNSDYIWDNMIKGEWPNIDEYLQKTKCKCINKNIDRTDIISEIKNLIYEIRAGIEKYDMTLLDIPQIQMNKFDSISTRNLESTFQYIIDFSYHSMYEMNRQNRSKSRPVVRKTIMQIKNDYNDATLNLRDIANSQGVNYTYLSKAFKQDTGISFVKYLNNYRIQIAKEMLKRTNKMMYEISYSVGIEPSHFNYVFRKIVGVTPSEYRKLNLESYKDK